MELEKALELVVAYRKTCKNSTQDRYASKIIGLLNEMQLQTLSLDQQKEFDLHLSVLVHNFQSSDKPSAKKEYQSLVQLLHTSFGLTPKYFFTYQGVFIGMFFCSILFSLNWLIPGLLLGGYLGFLMDDRARKNGKQLRTPWMQWHWS